MTETDSAMQAKEGTENDVWFWTAELICMALQFVLFIPFYFVWRTDCKKIGKERLAVSLSERFFAWAVVFPLWIVPVLFLVKGR